MSTVLEYAQNDCRRHFTEIWLSGINNSNFFSQVIKNGETCKCWHFKMKTKDGKYRKSHVLRSFVRCLKYGSNETRLKFAVAPGHWKKASLPAYQWWSNNAMH